ncbi:UNKNOWN [Stylonychia lemnae]|uniref:Transmembrane protein n=1 Tax=Stylonychia lemnae TaxID=5949 RepID=A0A077ZSG2_STYLE|nr:UNKNOWN [Stylonychia lemnae]|eukprot:CDW71406.1 UNKNOWN [Stylonychia lemnae]
MQTQVRILQTLNSAQNPILLNPQMIPLERFLTMEPNQMKPYFDEFQQIQQQNLTEIRIVQGGYNRKPSNFNPTIKNSHWLSQPYNLEKRISEGILQQSAKTSTKYKFVTYNAGLVVEGFNFTEYSFVDSTTNSLFFPTFGAYRWINITNCYFQLEQQLVMTLEGGNIKIENSTINVITQNRIVIYTSMSVCSLYDNYGIANNQIWNNNIFTGLNIGGYTALIYTQNHCNFTLINNRFIDVPGLFVVQKLNMQNLKLIFANNYFQEIQNDVVETPVITLNVPNVIFKNNTIKKSVVPTFISLMAQNAIITILNSNNVDLYDIQGFNLIFKSSKFISCTSSTNIMLKNVDLKDSIANENHIFYFSQTKDVFFKNVTIANLTNKNPELLEPWKQGGSKMTYNFSDWSLLNSTYQLISIEAILADKYDQEEMILSFENIYLENIKLGGKQSMLQTSSFVYEQLEINFKNSAIKNCLIDIGSYFEHLHSAKAFNIQNLSFIENQGQFMSMKPSLSDDYSQPQRVYIENSNFLANYAGQTGLIYHTKNTNLAISRCSFTDNYSIGRGSLGVFYTLKILARWSQTNVILPRIMAQRLDQYLTLILKLQSISREEIFDSYLFKHFSTSVVRIKSLNYLSNNGSFLSIQDSIVFMNDSSIENSKHSSINNPMNQILRSQVLLKNCLINNILPTTTNKAIFYSFQSEIILENFTAGHFNQNLLQVEQSSIKINNSRFENATLGYDELGLALILYQSDATIQNSMFRNLHAQTGSAIYSHDKYSSTNQKMLMLSKCIFMQNLALIQGGSVFIQDIDALIENNTFESNLAQQHDGGALNLQCSTYRPQRGAIYYNLYSPSGLMTNSFNGNQALYGNDYGSYPFKLSLIQSAQISTQMIKSNKIDQDLVSGQKLNQTVYIGIFDQNDQLVNINSDSEALITSNDLKVQLSLNNKIASINGIFTFPDLMIVGKPNYQTTLRILSSSIDQEQYQLVSSSAYQDLVIDVNFRSCISGEISQNSKCIECPKGSYSFNPGNLYCDKCFQNGICLGEENILNVKKAMKEDFVKYVLEIQMENFTQILIRILTNYFHATLIVKEFDLNWPSQVEQALNSFSFLSSQQQSIFSFDCFYQNTQELGMPIFFFKVLMFGLLPIMLSLISSMLWIGLYTYKKYLYGKAFNLKQYITVTAFIFIYLCYPIITNQTFALFSCLSMDDQQAYLKSDYSIKCWVGQHQTMALYIGLTYIIFWTISFPLYVLYQLKKHHKSLNDKNLVVKYGLFFVGLNDNAFYWEILIVNARKIIFILCGTLLSSIVSEVKALIGIAVLISQVQLIHYQMPYIDPRFNEVEKQSIFAATLTLYGGMFFLQSEVQINNDALLFLFMVILFYNIFFLVKWTHRFFSILLRIHYAKLIKFSCFKFLKNLKVKDYQVDLQETIQKATYIVSPRRKGKYAHINNESFVSQRSNYNSIPNQYEQSFTNRAVYLIQSPVALLTNRRKSKLSMGSFAPSSSRLNTPNTPINISNKITNTNIHDGTVDQNFQNYQNNMLSPMTINYKYNQSKFKTPTNNHKHSDFRKKDNQSFQNMSQAQISPMFKPVVDISSQLWKHNDVMIMEEFTLNNYDSNDKPISMAYQSADRSTNHLRSISKDYKTIKKDQQVVKDVTVGPFQEFVKKRSTIGKDKVMKFEEIKSEEEEEIDKFQDTQ